MDRSRADHHEIRCYYAKLDFPFCSPQEVRVAGSLFKDDRGTGNTTIVHDNIYFVFPECEVFCESLLERGRDLFLLLLLLLLLLLCRSKEYAEVVQDVFMDTNDIREHVTDFSVFFFETRKKMADGIERYLAVELGDHLHLFCSKLPDLAKTAPQVNIKGFPSLEYSCLLYTSPSPRDRQKS